MSHLIAQAEQLARQLHSNQVDKANKPYIEHLAFVAHFVADQDDNVIATAWLHDSVEDTAITLNEIEIKFGGEIVKAVEAMTKRKGENYQDYLLRVKANEIARKVKIADLIHNMDLSRLEQPTEKDHQRTKKYQNAYQFLID